MVEYREISGFPSYRVGNDGSVWSLFERSCRGIGNGSGCKHVLGKTWRRLKENRSGKYSRVSLYRNGTMFVKQVHQLVLEAFVGPCPDGMEACHYPERDTKNNSLPNLRWDTPKANQVDRLKHGMTGIGEKNGSAKLTWEQVRAIRASHPITNGHKKRLANGEAARLSKEFGVSLGHIRKIIRHRLWKEPATSGVLS